MPRGGKREGAGRKAGQPNRKTQAVAAQAIAEGITALEVMVNAMRWHHYAGRYDDAARVARDVAPYMHPRLAAIEHSTKDGKPLSESVVVYGGVLIKAEEANTAVVMPDVPEPAPALLESSECSGSS